MAFSYVRRKDNPNVYLMAGYCDFSGQFDEVVYEQVEGSLPEEAIAERKPSATEALDAQARLLNADARATLAANSVAIRHLLEKNPADTEAAILILEGLPDEPFLALKQAVLGTLA